MAELAGSTQAERRGLCGGPDGVTGALLVQRSAALPRESTCIFELEGLFSSDSVRLSPTPTPHETLASFLHLTIRPPGDIDASSQEQYLSKRLPLDDPEASALVNRAQIHQHRSSSAYNGMNPL